MNNDTAAQRLHTGVLILAAGAGRRMGGRAKCLLEVQGESLLQRLVQSVHSLGLATPVLVLGHHAADIQAHLAQWPEHLAPRQVVNPMLEDDTTSSLHMGLHALGNDVQAVVVLLADQPLINAADIGAVWHAFERRPPSCQVLMPTVDGVPGHPVIFDAAVRAALLATPGTSLRQWRAAHPHACVMWAVDNAHHTRDLDTPDDVHTLAHDTGWVCRWPELLPGVNTDPVNG